MSESRTPIEKITREVLPGLYGKKSHKICLKIELFPARSWATKWEPGSVQFYPKAPLHDKARKEYWEARYRVRINGKWHSDKAKYMMLTRKQILDKFLS